jgi:hypothetical protein
MAFTPVTGVTTSFSSVTKPTTSWTANSKPTTVFGKVIDVAQNCLLINTIDFLLINAIGDRLLINETRDSNFSGMTRPSIPTYTAITKPA